MGNNISNNFQGFDLSTILDRLGLSGLSREQEEEVIGHFASLIQSRISDYIIDKLSEEELQDMEVMRARSDTVGLENYLNTKIADEEYDRVIEDTIALLQARVNQDRAEVLQIISRLEQQSAMDQELNNLV